MDQKAKPGNRLVDEPSLYLRQHAHNPVDWYPWSREALDRAFQEDKPILLSIGYSSCHWCHVMAHESFEEPGTAQLMNASFVNIKVDREERPDLDHIYMEAVQAMTGGGGWPLTLFLTPDGRPFYGGTYFPPHERHGLPAFPSLLRYIEGRYRTRRDEIEEAADGLAKEIQRAQHPAWMPGELAPGLLEGARRQLMQAYEPKAGGFGFRPKFPQPVTLQLLLRLAGDDPEAMQAYRHTLNAMAMGGMYDLAGGGFHRYSVDEHWLVPHFEKMLYDNALLAAVYCEGYVRTGDEHYRRVVEQTLDYLLAEMEFADGGFAAAQDADTSEGEGYFYSWSEEEFREAVGVEDVAWAVEYFGVTRQGNFHGRNLLRQGMSVGQLASRLGTTADDVLHRLDHVRARLLAARAERPLPARDDKLMPSWNGFAISAFAVAGDALGRDDYVDAAERAAEFILREMWAGNGRLRHFAAGESVHGDAFIDDYANLIASLLDLYQVDRGEMWLTQARTLTQVVLNVFWDDAEDTFYYATKEHETPVARPKRFSDLPIPSGNSMMAVNLLRLSAIQDRPDLRALAERVLRRFVEPMSKSAQGFSQMLIALDLYLRG